MIRVLAGFAFAALAGTACAQAIERNLPPPVQPGPPLIAAPGVLPNDQDATPLGADLTAIVVLGPDDAVVPAAPPGVDLRRAGRLDRKSARRALARFLSRPLSRKLIGEIEAAIVLDYRRAGHPLVSASTPPQEITSGVLQVRVIEFRLGTRTAPGAHPAATVLGGVRARPGEPVDTTLLEQDLDWLNRWPFRHSEAVFSPGAAAGTTDLILATTQTKPWSAYAGYANSGSPLTGPDRYFLGASVALPLLPDSYAAWQLTTSPNGPLWKNPAGATYLSHAGRLVIGIAPRQDIEATFSFIHSTQPVPGTAGFFTSRQATYEASLAWRSALSNFLAVLPGEVVFGLEARRQESATLFGDFEIFAARQDIFQLTAGWAGQEDDRFGHLNGEVTVHASPGGVDRSNVEPGAGHRAVKARYAYVTADATRVTPLPAGFAWRLSLIGQYAAVALPVTEQIGLGGAGLTRVYTLDDGAFDAGLVARDELRAPPIGLFSRIGPLKDVLSPFVFLDAGWGRNYAARADGAAVSTGIGTDYQLGRHFTAALSAGWALKDEGLTRAGAFRLESRVSVAF